MLEYCNNCKVSFCLECSKVVHSKGKFMVHVRNVSQSPEKMKRTQTLKTENCELEVSIRREKKESAMNQEYGFKNKNKNTPLDRSKPLQFSTSSHNKKGKSMAKVPLDNQ